MVSYLDKCLPSIHERLKESTSPHLMLQNNVGILLFWLDTASLTSTQDVSSKSIKKSGIVIHINLNEGYQNINL